MLTLHQIILKIFGSILLSEGELTLHDAILATRIAAAPHIYA